jgi:hypothetical protein
MHRRLGVLGLLALSIGALPAFAQEATPTNTSQAALQIPHSTPRAPAVVHDVLPQDTDPAIDDALAPHRATVAPCDQPSGYLVLFLPGTGGSATAASPSALLRVATQNCLHGISLTYQNANAVWGDCVKDPDPNCYENWRMQKLDGVPRSTYVTTNQPNSIQNRLLRLLEYLAATYPDEGWDTYLNDGGVRWERVIVTGESQGGGMAALIGHVHLAARVVMFASITDAIGGFNGPSPDWVAKPSATPAERYFGFAHIHDQWWPAEQKNWASLSLNQFGSVVNVDSAAPPYGGSHMLSTDIQYNHAVPNGAHPTVAAGTNAERFNAVWEYLLISG